MKTLLFKLKFFFLRRVSWKNMNYASRHQLLFIFNSPLYANVDVKKLVFIRTFEFNGIWPLFWNKETGYAYFVESNEVD